MNTNVKKVNISTSEIARTLQWPWSTVDSIKRRQAPKDKLTIINNCEDALIKAKKELQNEFNNTQNLTT